MDSEKIFQDFIKQNQINNMSNTIKAYEKDLKDFLAYLKKNSLDIKTLKSEDLALYFDDLERKYKKSSLNRKLTSLKNFYKYLFDKMLVDKIPSFEPINKKIKTLVSTNKEQDYDNKEVREILKEIEALPPKYENDRLKLIVTLLSELKINLENLLAIDIENIVAYAYKKIVVKRENKIFSYDLEEELSEQIKKFISLYRVDEKFLFEDINSIKLNEELAKFNLNTKKLKKLNEVTYEEIKEEIKREYFRIGLGDE